MADAEVKYETKTVTTVRGMEPRSIKKAEADGWELISQTPATLLRTTLTFRRAKKPFPRWAIYAGAGAASLAVVGIVLGVVLGGGDGSSQTSPSATATAVANVKVPDVTGREGDVAKKTVEEAGFDVKFDAGDDYVILSSNWNVISQTPKAGEVVPTGSTVTLKVVKKVGSTESPKPSETAAPAPSAAPVEATTLGLTGTYAESACDQYGSTAFPYGWDPHFVSGILADEAQGDHWFMKFEADVTDEYGAKRSAEVECTVTGTNTAPYVSEFNAY